MVYDTYNYSYIMVFKNNLITGGPHLVDVCFSLTPPCFRDFLLFQIQQKPLNSDHTWNLFHAAVKITCAHVYTVNSLEERQTTHINWHFWTHLFTSKISRKALGDGSRFCMSIQQLGWAWHSMSIPTHTRSKWNTRKSQHPIMISIPIWYGI